jgi:hypothetical protein
LTRPSRSCPIRRRAIMISAPNGSIESNDSASAQAHPHTCLITHGSPERRPLITGVGVELTQKREQPEQRLHEQRAAVAVLKVGGMHDRVQNQALRVYEQMPLLALDLLARIVAVRIDRRPPFSALLTLWLLCRGASRQVFYSSGVVQFPARARASLRGRHVRPPQHGVRGRGGTICQACSLRKTLLSQHTQSDELTSPIVPGGDLVAEADPSTVRQLRALHSSETPSFRSTCGAE